MNILFHFDSDQDKRMENALREQLPGVNFHTWPDCPNPADIECAIVWKAPDAFFEGLTNLRWIFSLGAGVDHVLQHESIPVHIPLVRLEDAGMSEKMEEYVLYGVLHAHRRFPLLQHNQRNNLWDDDIKVANARDFHVGLLGFGVLGQRVADRLMANHYQVSAWSRSVHRPTESQVSLVLYHGDAGLEEMVGLVDVLVCLLPLTKATQGIINRTLLNQLKPGAFLINAARGGHVVDDDLLQALEAGHLGGALLDVTNIEPLPASHPYWQHPKVIISPHIAAPTQYRDTARQIADKYHAILRGEMVSGVVDRTRGY